MNVFFVGGALEYLNAVEARHHFEVAASDALLLVLQTSDTVPGGFDLRTIVERSDWQRVVFFERPRRSVRGMRRVLRQVNDLAQKLGPVQRLVMGGYLSTVRRHFANCVQHEELILLDEGVSTLHVHALRRSRRGAAFRAGDERLLLPRWSDRMLRGGFLRELAMRLLRVHDAHPKALTWFTMYDLEPHGDDRLVRNEYAYLRSRVRDVPVADELLFLGEPLHEEGIIQNEAAWLQLVRFARDRHPDLRFVYKPHRLEDPRKLARLRDAVGIEISQVDEPVELLLLRRDHRPQRVASAYSSALGTCGRIFGLPAVAFVLDPVVVVPAFRGHVQSIVDAFAADPTGAIEIVRVPAA